MAAKTLKDYANILTGTQVIVEDEDGSLYTGILREFSDELEVCLSFAQKLPTSPDSQYILSNRNTMKEFRLKAVRLTGDYCAKESESTFRTDHEIGCNGDIGSDNEFQQWEDDGDGLDDKLGDLNETKNEKWRKKKKAGWSVDEMFKANIDKCVGESNFDENLTQYSNVEVGQRSREELERATELAKLIENNPISKRNALLENDDEERDLDAVTTFKEDKEAKERQRQEAKPNHNKKSPTPTPVSKPTLPAAEKKIEMKNEPVDENEAERNVKAEEPQKKQFQFNPNASPFVPTKGRDLNSKPPTPAANNFNSPANFPSHQQNQHVPTFVPVQMPTAVPMQPAPHMGGLPPPNLVYGMYPQQQVVQNVMYNPLYANAGQQPTMFMQPNQTFLLQQQGINPQQQPQFITMGMAAAPPPQQQNVQQSHSRTGTPTNGNNVLHQPQQQQSLMDANTTGNGQVQQQQQPMTTLYQNHAQLVPTGPNNALPLMNIPQLQSMMPMPASSVAAAYSHQFQQQMPPNYVQQQQHHQQQQQQQQYSALVNHQQQQPQQLHQQAQPYALSRSSSVHLPQHFQQQTLNLQQAVANQQNAAAAAAGVYVTNSPYATPLMQQPVSYYIPQQHGMMAPSIVPPPPHLTHTMHPPAGQHGRQQ